jgi:ElaB/YqjD/DUF883 family membrane-anchored ribosome-binding protein
VAQNEYGVTTSSSSGNRSQQVQAGLRKFAGQAADRVKGTANYFKDRPMKDVASDARRYAAAHPAQCLATAVAIGFLAGRMFRRY